MKYFRTILSIIPYFEALHPNVYLSSKVFKIYLKITVLILPSYTQVVLTAEFTICIDIKWIQDAPEVRQ